MDREGLRLGHLVALAGAAVLLAALWLPWYELRLGPVERSQLTQGAGQLGAPFAALAEGVAAQLDGMGVTAWQLFEGQDVLFAVGAGAVVLVLLAASGAVAGVRVEPAAAAQLASGAGLVLGAFATFRLITRPAPPELFTLATGPWVALGGCVLMVAGGTLARRPTTSSAHQHPPPGPSWALEEVGRGATSVAPPPRRA